MKIFVICHDDASETTAYSLIEQWRKDEDKVAEPIKFCVIRNRIKTVLFENVVYDILDARQQTWQNEDYVGLITYSANIKWRYKDMTQLAWSDLRKNLTQSGTDVLGLYPLDFIHKNAKISYIKAAVMCHGMNFLLTWRALLTRLGYTNEQCESKDVQGFFCNWWIGRPECFQRYIKFYKKVVQLIDGDDEVKQLIRSDAHYLGRQTMSRREIAEIFHGHEFFMLHPFILERLPFFFFHFEKDISVKFLGPRIPFGINT